MTRRPLPGDAQNASLVDRIIRVDHAGEYGAKRIYEGQLAVLKNDPTASVIHHMADQEQQHLETFEQLIIARKVRPTLLQPLWHIAGFALGAATALLGPKAAMACTVAVEETIDTHYNRQIEMLDDEEATLRHTLTEFRKDEIAHRDTGLAYGAEEAPAYPLLKTAVSAATRLAIFLSERI
ncbi:MAG: demethoxyubiquinone hydroxylase family protein [Alphaproteobacteria bacterium]